MRRAPATAKLNLALVVGPRRGDGRHEVVTVLQRLDLADRIAVEPAPRLRVEGFPEDRLVGRALAAGLSTSTCNHTFRATGITTYLKNGGRVEVAQHMAGHESVRTTGLYDRRGDEVSLDEVERIVI